MRSGAVLVGLLSWTAAVVVPGWYVIGMARAALPSPHYSYSLEDLLGKFTSMPWPLWIYSIAMTLIGTLLVVGGLRQAAKTNSDDLSI